MLRKCQSAAAKAAGTYNPAARDGKCSPPPARSCRACCPPPRCAALCYAAFILPNITALLSRESVALVSGQCGVPQWPGTTKLSRGVGEQRGHAWNAAPCLSCAARCGSAYQASPLWFYRRSFEASQWRKRGTAIAKRPRCCRVASTRSAVMCRRQSLHFVASAPDRLMTSEGLWSLAGHAATPAASAPSRSAVRHSGQSLRACQQHITALGLPAWQG